MTVAVVLSCSALGCDLADVCLLAEVMFDCSAPERFAAGDIWQIEVIGSATA